jgi:hypothetical protein
VAVVKVTGGVFSETQVILELQRLVSVGVLGPTAHPGLPLKVF